MRAYLTQTLKQWARTQPAEVIAVSLAIGWIMAVIVTFPGWSN